MPWDRSAPSAPKYHTAEHRRTRARLMAQLQRDGYAICAQPICLAPTRTIRPGMRVHLGHDDTGTRYIGLVHARCNVVDGARRGRARQQARPPWSSRTW